MKLCSGEWCAWACCWSPRSCSAWLVESRGPREEETQRTRVLAGWFSWFSVVVPLFLRLIAMAFKGSTGVSRCKPSVSRWGRQNVVCGLRDPHSPPQVGALSHNSWVHFYAQVGNCSDVQCNYNLRKLKVMMGGLPPTVYNSVHMCTPLK